MQEVVYVLMVEALIFGFVSVVLVVQRLDVWDWSDSSVLPVFGTSILILLIYAQFLLSLCCFVAIGRFGTIAHNIMDACARSAGRVSSIVFVSLAYVCGLMWIYQQSNPKTILCILGQLWNKSCALQNPIMISYSVYLAVLLPVFTMICGLQTTAAGMCKDVRRASSRRLISMNCVYVLVFTVIHTLDRNLHLGCQQACNELARTKNDESTMVKCKDVLYLTGALCFADICAEIILSDSIGNKFLRACVFSLIRVGQVLSVLLFNHLAESGLPTPLLIVQMILSSAMCALDVIDLFTHSDKQIVPVQHPLISVPSLPDVTIQANTPFTMEGPRKKMRMLTFTGRSRWPTLSTLPELKKKTS